MSTLQGKRILILQQRVWGTRIGHFLGKKLQAEGARLAAITFKPTVHEFTLKQKEVSYELVLNDDAALAGPKEYLGGADYTLEEICSALGIDSVWPLAHTMRHHVRSYGEEFYYGWRQNVSDEEIVLYIKSVYHYLRRMFDEFQPEIVLSPSYVALPHIMCSLFAKRRGAKMIVASDCKVRGISIFVNDYLESTGEFYDRVVALNDQGADSPNREKARQYIAGQRQSLQQPLYSDKFNPHLSLWRRIRAELAPYRAIVRFLRNPKDNYISSLGITYDWRPPRIILRDHFAKKRYKKAALRFPYTPLSALGKFVLFPLQFQPESTIDVVAPYFSNQLEVARLVAMALPDDYTLAVRDHPVMFGFRSDSFLNKLQHTPNVKVIDFRLPMAEVIKAMSAMVSISSTAVAEAAFYGKPAIQLGSLGTTKLLPNVTVHHDFTTLSAVIKKSLAASLHTAEYERHLENYVAAAYDTGFGFDYVSAWERGKGNLEELWPVYKKELVRIFS